MENSFQLTLVFIFEIIFVPNFDFFSILLNTSGVNLHHIYYREMSMENEYHFLKKFSNFPVQLQSDLCSFLSISLRCSNGLLLSS